MFIHPGLSQNYQQFGGVIFQFVRSTAIVAKRSQRGPLAYGGRYDKLLHSFMQSHHRASQNQMLPSIVGFSILEDALMNSLEFGHVS